jgi:hypothetical protein
MKQLWSLLGAAALVAALATTAARPSLGGAVRLHQGRQDYRRVLKFQAINPHMRLTLRVTDDKGTRDLELEGHSTNNMYRAGYRNGMIKVGDTITVDVAPLRDGREGGYVIAAVTAAGTRFGVQSAADRARERERAEGK